MSLKKESFQAIANAISRTYAESNDVQKAACASIAIQIAAYFKSCNAQFDATAFLAECRSHAVDSADVQKTQQELVAPPPEFG